MIVITIDTDNVAFQDGDLQYELEKVFNSILGKINRSDTFGIMDSKGNIIGNYKRE